MVQSNRPPGVAGDLVKSAIGSAAVAGPRRLTRAEAVESWNVIARLILKRGPLPTSPAAREARLIGALADLRKAAAAQSRQEILVKGAAASTRKTKRKKSTKALRVVSSDITKATARQEYMHVLEARLAKVEKMPAPGMPSRMARFPGAAADDRQVAALRRERDDLVKRAEATTDRNLRIGFEEMADDVANKIDKLGGM